MKKYVFLFCSFLLLSYISFGQYQSKIIVFKVLPQNNNTFSSNELFVNFLKQNAASYYKIFPNHNTPSELSNKYGQPLVDLSLWYQLKYSANTKESTIIQQLQAFKLFEYIEQRPLNSLFYTPNDSLLGHQWYLNNIHAFDAWDIEQGDSNVVVGVTDTGIDRVGEDLKEGIKYNYFDPVDGIDNDNDGFIDNYCGWDVGNNDNNVQWGPIGHGTFVAGFVSAVPDNGKGIAGVGYHIKTLPVKIDNTEGKLIHDYEGIVYAADHSAAIINCAWGGPVFTQFGKDIINYATFNRDALVVAACGNSNNDTWMYPASYENVLSVAATDSLDVRWAQSSYGPQVDLCAPGTFVYSTWVNNIYFSSHGTSFSAPMVAAAAALVKSKYPWMNALQLGEQMRVSTDYIDSIAGNNPTKDKMGSGRLNMVKALTDTLSPSIRFNNINVQTSKNITADTLQIIGEFTNYLRPSSNVLTATISCTSPYISIIDSVVNIGILNTLASISNTSTPFRLLVDATIPLGKDVDIKISYQDGNYTAFEFFRIQPSKDYLNIDTNQIILTLSSISRLGFNDDKLNQGVGMIYKGGRSMMAMGGFLVATSSNRVSDNIYGIQAYDHDFETITNIHKSVNPKNSDQSFYTKFNDDGASFNKQYIEVKQYSYAYNQNGKDKFVILEYHIFNKGNTILNNLYAALFMDFDINNSTTNKAAYDAPHQLAYTYQALGGKNAGIMLLEGKNANSYCIDNDGSNGSVSIYDGFYGFEKFQSMTQSRDSAGYGNGGDVSNMLSTGPYTITQNDSIVVSFAILAGDHLVDLQNSAQAAYDMYYNTAAINNRINQKNNLQLQINPNPISDAFQLVIYNPKYQDLIFNLRDSNGRLIKEWIKTNVPNGQSIYDLRASSFNLKFGVYYLNVISEKEQISQKLIILP